MDPRIISFKKNHYILLLILTLCLVAIAGFVTGTFAYFKQDGSAENFLYAKKLKVELADIFDGTQPILPGDTLNKDVYMKNTGEVNSVVRIRLTPSWETPADLLSQARNPSAVTVTLGEAASENWTYIDGWYYYNKILKPGDTTTYLVDNLKLSAVSNDDHSVNYSNASYTLAVESQSLQAESLAAQETWGLVYQPGTNDMIVWSAP